MLELRNGLGANNVVLSNVLKKNNNDEHRLDQVQERAAKDRGIANLSWQKTGTAACLDG